MPLLRYFAHSSVRVNVSSCVVWADFKSVSWIEKHLTSGIAFAQILHVFKSIND